MADTKSNDNPSESSNLWLPLESDPIELTRYLRMLTNEDQYYLIDIPCIDLIHEIGIFDFHEILAYVFLFTMEKHALLGQVETDPMKTKNLFFMKQLVPNSCGTVALLHSYLNAVPVGKSDQNSWIKKFYDENHNKTPEERGESFANIESFQNLHHEAALHGQSEIPTGEQLSNVDFHYVAFVEHNGFIFELDGRLEGPLNHGPTTGDRFKRDALKIIQEYMALDPDNLHFCVLALCRELEPRHSNEFKDKSE